jgi:hypothetical protein
METKADTQAAADEKGTDLGSGEKDADAPLELRAWIELAAARGLIATVDDFAALPLGEDVHIVPLEYSKFLLHEYPERHPKPEAGVAYAPRVFFEPLCNAFARATELKDVRLVYHTPGGVAEGMRPGLTGRLTMLGGQVCARAGIHSTRDDRHAESGSGDGYSRYVLWRRLADSGMPPVFNGPDY